MRKGFAQIKEMLIYRRLFVANEFTLLFKVVDSSFLALKKVLFTGNQKF